MRIKYILLVFAALLLFVTGCAAKDDFADDPITKYPPIEYLSAKTEFTEYDGNTEDILVYLTNDSDEFFYYDLSWSLEKEVDGEWRAIRFVQNRINDCLARAFERGTASIRCYLKEYVKLPLLPGHYRIWVGGGSERVPAEFDIK